jgi:hypothetical protein
MQFDSPFMQGGEVTLDDVAFAAFVCSKLMREGIPLLMDGNLDLALTEWGREFGEIDFEQAHKDLETHIANYMKWPAIWADTKSTKQSNIEWPFRFVADVALSTSWAEEYIWDMAINRLACYRACIAEDNGHEVQTQTAKSIIERIHEMGLQESDEVIQGDG